MTRFSRLFFAVFAAATVLAACSSTGEVDDVAPVSTTEPPSTTTTSTVAPTSTDVSTTILNVPSPDLASPGLITIGSDEYAFAFECYAAGAGDILALGIGTDPNSNGEVQAVVQAFLGQAYVAIIDGDSGIRELAVDEPADLFVQGDAIRGSALRFVDVGASPGVGEELGLGTVSVDCQGFAPGLPDGYELS